MARHPVRGRTVLVTGAGRGIGADAARRLAARGARVAVLDVDAALAEAVAGELGADAIAVACDVTDRAGLDAAVAEVVERLGGIDVAIANAGIAAVGTVATMPYEEFERVVEVDLLGVWRTIRAVLPHVVERRGYLLAVSSLAAAVHLPLLGPYTAAKAGVEALCDALRVEVASRGVRVGVAYFGIIDTDMARAGLDHPAAVDVRRRSRGIAGRSLPVGRAGEAIARGVERRSRRVVAPRWILPAILAPGVLVQPLFDFGPRRLTARAIAIAEEMTPETTADDVP